MDVKKKAFIYFRANAEIGYGHFSRAKALKEILKNDFEVELISTSNDPNQTFADEILVFPNLKAILSHVKNHEPSFLMIDDYKAIDEENIDLLWQKENLTNHKLCFVLDYEKREYKVDLILSPTGAKFSLNSKLKAFVWPEFSLTSKEFYNNKTRLFSVRKSLVCFGGADPFKITEKFLNQADKAFLKNSSVVCGPLFESERYKAIKTEHLDVKFYKSISQKELNALMNSHTDFICTASGLALEALSTHLPCYAVKVAENQSDLFKLLITHDFLLGGHDHIKNKEIDFGIYTNFSKAQISDKSTFLENSLSTSIENKSFLNHLKNML